MASSAFFICTSPRQQQRPIPARPLSQLTVMATECSLIQREKVKLLIS